MPADQLAEALRNYLEEHGLTQREFADLIGFSQPYVSRILSGKRPFRSVDERRRVASALDLPPHMLGVVQEEPDTQPLELADPNIALARSMLDAVKELREAGKVREARRHVDQVLTFLTPHRGKLDAAGLQVLAWARVLRGTLLGDVLPKELASQAVDEVNRGRRVAEQLDEPEFMAQVLHRLGNEQRKAGEVRDARDAVVRAAELARDPGHRAAALVHVARVHGELRDRSALRSTLAELRSLLEDPDVRSPTAHPFIADEVELRGALTIGSGWEKQLRRVEASLDERPPPIVAPQWVVIRLITDASLLLRRGDVRAAEPLLFAALGEAQRMGLSQQLQRIDALLNQHRDLTKLDPIRLDLSDALRRGRDGTVWR